VRIRFEIQESANFQFQYCCAGYGIRWKTQMSRCQPTYCIRAIIIARHHFSLPEWICCHACAHAS
jgi:hypothetical protein